MNMIREPYTIEVTSPLKLKELREFINKLSDEYDDNYLLILTHDFGIYELSEVKLAAKEGAYNKNTKPDNTYIMFT